MLGICVDAVWASEWSSNSSSVNSGPMVWRLPSSLTTTPRRELCSDYSGADVRVIKRNTWIWWEQVSLARLLRDIRPDVYVAPANYGIPLVRPRKMRSVLIVHDLIPLLLWRRYLRPRPLWALMYLVSTVCALLAADEIISVSETTATEVHRLGWRRSQVIYPPIPLRRELGLLQRRNLRKYIVYMGGLDDRKNVYVLLEAFALFSRSVEGAAVDLVLLGEGMESLSPILQHLGIDGRCELTGFVDDQAKWKWLEQALCVAYPSSYEGFGLVVAEAFACGVPVVTGSGGALGEVGGRATIVVDPCNAASIADGLRLAVDARVAATAAAEGYSQLERLRERSGGYVRAITGASSSHRASRGDRRRTAV